MRLRAAGSQTVGGRPCASRDVRTSASTASRVIPLHSSEVDVGTGKTSRGPPGQSALAEVAKVPRDGLAHERQPRLGPFGPYLDRVTFRVPM